MSNATPVRYHLSKSNKPVVCKASVRPCPRVDYDTLVEAQVVGVERGLPVDLPEAHLLATVVVRQGVNPHTLVDEDGVSLAERWRQQFTLNETDAQLMNPETLIRDIVPLDFGRERGVNFEWRKPGDPIDSDDNAMDVSYVAEEFDDYLAQGYRPVIWVHTRNGGGNRECYCDDVDTNGHEARCLEQINERMAEHPLYLHDQDDSYDYTYANFYFKVPEARIGEVKRAHLNAPRRRVAEHTIGLRQSLIEDTAGKYQELLFSVFPPQRVNSERYTAMGVEIERLTTELKNMQRDVRSSATVAGIIMPEYKFNQDANLAQMVSVGERVLAGEHVAAQEAREVGFHLPSFEVDKKNHVELATMRTEQAERANLLQRMRALDPALADEAARHLSTSPKDAHRLEELTQKVGNADAKLATFLGRLRRYRDLAAHQKQLRADRTRVGQFSHYPGDPLSLRLPVAED